MSDAPDSSTAVPPPRPIVVRERPPRRWIAEAILILASVALGFAASEFGQYRQERGLAAAVLRAVTREVEDNEKALSVLVAKHGEWRDAMASADTAAASKAAYRVLLDTRPDGAAHIGVPLSSAAWQMAVSSGALRLLDFEVAQALSEIYTLQTTMTEHHNRFVSNALYSAAAFDPAAAAVATKMLWGVLGEVEGEERWLLDLYRKHLPLLKRAAAN